MQKQSIIRAVNRICVIQIVCQELLDGHELACVSGFGDKVKCDEAAEFFDNWGITE